MDLFLSERDRQELDNPVFIENETEELGNNFVLLDYRDNEYAENMVFANHHTLLEQTQALSESSKTFGDSKSMKDVKESLRSLYVLLNKTIPDEKEEFIAASTEIAAKYEELLGFLEFYIDNHKPVFANGKARLAMIKEIYASAKQEKEYFEGGATAYSDSQFKDIEAPEDDIEVIHDFLYVLKFARASSVDIEMISEGGSTDSIRKYTEDGETYYYKKTEYTLEMDDYSKLASDRYEKLMEGKYGPLYSDLIKEVDAIQNAIASAANGRVDKFEEFIVKLHDTIMDLVFSTKETSTYKKAMKRLDELGENEGFAVSVRGLKALFERHDRTFRKIAGEIGSPLHTASIAKHNKIHAGANLTMRSVATSRLDKFLGINGIVETKSVLVKGENGIVSTGMRMESAEGVSMSELKKLIERRNKAEGKVVAEARFSPEAAKKFQEILLLDFLMGQADRHNGNIKVTYEEVNGFFIIKDVIGIDNDMCLGDLSGSKVNYGFNRIIPLLKKSSGGKIRSAADCVIQAVHKDTYDKFMALQPETLLHMFADCGLSKEEWVALKDRLTVIKSALIAIKVKDDENKKHVEGGTEERKPLILDDDEFSQSAMDKLFSPEAYDSKSLLNLMAFGLHFNGFKKIPDKEA